MLSQIVNALLKFVCGGGNKEDARPPQQQQQQEVAQKPPSHGYPPGHKPQQHDQQAPQHHQPPPQQHHQGAPLPHHKHQDLNQINQHDEHYTSLRARANEEGDKMASCFERSHKAYESGDGASAKDLSNQGKEHQRRMEDLNREASDWIFQKNNEDSKSFPGGVEIDLHGLYVKEAIDHTDRALEEAKRRGDKEVHLIVGKGLHSPGGAAKLKPAIEDLMQKHQLMAEMDPHNSGVLVVHVQSGDGRGVGSDEITRRLERKDEDCIIM